MKKQSAILTVAILLTVCLTRSSQARSISISNNQYDDQDPMLAMPSSTNARRIQKHQPYLIDKQEARATETEVQYVYANGQVVPTSSSLNKHYPAVQIVHEYHHQIVPAQAQQRPTTQASDSTSYQMVQVSSEPNHVHNHNGIDCNKKHEYSSIISLPNIMPASQETVQTSLGQQHQSALKSVEYPGEIIYVDQNGENYNAQNFAGYLPRPSKEKDAPKDLPATILTEVPLNDMPYDVLERLKQEYGVRVVAIRERPGANLVINCDEYAHHANSICNRQAQGLEVSNAAEQHHQIGTTTQQDDNPHLIYEYSSQGPAPESVPVNYYAPSHVAESYEHQQQPPEERHVVVESSQSMPEHGLGSFAHRDGSTSSDDVSNQYVTVSSTDTVGEDSAATERPSSNVVRSNSGQVARKQYRSRGTSSRQSEQSESGNSENGNGNSNVSEANERPNDPSSEVEAEPAPVTSPSPSQPTTIPTQKEQSADGDQEIDPNSGFNYEQPKNESQDEAQEQPKQSDNEQAYPNQ